MDDLVKVGIIGKPHGTKGAVILHLTKEVDWESIDALFLEIQNDFVPFLIEEVNFIGKKMVVKLENISSMNDAKKFTNYNVWVKKYFVIEEEWNKCIGYKVIDINNDNYCIGTIKEFITNNQLIWMNVKSDNSGENILLPYNEELIEKISEEEQTIYYKAVVGMY
ncbi:MAG: hypothetical protein KatS3mg027_1071 [Bacteroidia bacterium]|nr:MAG: hypothetical protein KatS3mg027_1071 [Bacteroidia bacterium]